MSEVSSHSRYRRPFKFDSTPLRCHILPERRSLPIHVPLPLQDVKGFSSIRGVGPFLAVTQHEFIRCHAPGASPDDLHRVDPRAISLAHDGTRGTTNSPLQITDAVFARVLLPRRPAMIR